MYRQFGFALNMEDIFEVETEEFSFKSLVKLNDNSVDNPEKFWYLATPYGKYKEGRHNLAYLDAARMLALLEDNDIFVFCPITHYHLASYHTKNYAHDDGEHWNTKCLNWVRLSKGLIVCMMEGWEESEGIKKEIELANKLNLPVYYTHFLELPKFD